MRPAHRRVLAPRLADLGEPWVPGKPETISTPLIFQQFHDLGGAVMAVAAHRDLDPGPMMTDTRDDMPEDSCRLRAGGPLAGTQQRQHRLGCRRLEDVDGLEAVAVVMGVEQRQLLAAVDRVVGIVDVEHDAFRHAGEAVAEQIDHRQSHARQSPP